jgi:quercetin dioxygenase-like cupin family protein
LTEQVTDRSSVRAYQFGPGEGCDALWLPWHEGGRVTIKATAEHSEGRFSQVEFDDVQGTSPPLHIHRSGDESFYVVTGEIDVVCDDERFEAEAGDYVFIPRGRPHTYLVRSERAKLLATYALPGFEQFFVDNGVKVVPGEPAPALMAPDPVRFAESALRHHCEILGPPLQLAD